MDGSGSTYAGSTSFVVPGNAPFGIQVFPNPTARELSVRYVLPGAASGLDRVEIYDVSGRKVMERPLADGGEAAGVLRLNPRSVPGAGMYFVRLSRGRKVVASARVVIMR